MYILEEGILLHLYEGGNKIVILLDLRFIYSTWLSIHSNSTPNINEN